LAGYRGPSMKNSGKGEMCKYGVKSPTSYCPISG
jgi:hypothetical protein